MFILKIRWMRHENDQLADESDHFILADQITATGWIKSDDEMAAWSEDQYFDFRNVQNITNASDDIGGTRKMNGRLIEAILNGKSTWYLATSAWLLGPDGKTIEHLTAS